MYFANNGSYSSKFSTIYRTTQGARVSTELGIKDYSGIDPVPDHIAKAHIMFACSPGSSDVAMDSLHPETENSNQALLDQEVNYIHSQRRTTL